MREARRVKIHAESVDPGPGDPIAEMVRCDGVAVNPPGAELSITGVKVHAMCAGNQCQRFLQIGAEFVRRAGLAGMIACDRKATAERLARVFKSAHIVALPALERDGNDGELFQRSVRVHAGLGVAFPGQIEGGLNVFCAVQGSVKSWGQENSNLEGRVNEIELISGTAPMIRPGCIDLKAGFTGEFVSSGTYLEKNLAFLLP